jgi:hypothetical protein
MGLAELLEKILTLTSNVESLKSEMRAIREMVMDHHDRIVRLENSEELIAEKAKNAALGAVSASTFQLQKEVAVLQARVAGADSPSPSIKISGPLGSGERATKS